MDDLGELLIHELQLTPRATFSDLARRTGVARATAGQRLGELFADGTVRVVAAVHPGLLGLHALGHVAIHTAGPSQTVIDALRDMDGVVFLSRTVGQAQIVAELHAPDRPSLTADLSRIRALPGVSRTEVLTYEHVVKSLFCKPEPPPADVVLDAPDAALIAVMQHDGRATYTDLAAATGLPPSTCRNRVGRLLDSGSLHIGVVRRRTGTETAMAFGLGFRTSGPQEPLLDALATTHGIEFIATCTGRFDTLATIGARSPRAFVDIAGALCALPHVQALETWQHAEIVDERYSRPLRTTPPVA